MWHKYSLTSLGKVCVALSLSLSITADAREDCDTGTPLQCSARLSAMIDKEGDLFFDPAPLPPFNQVFHDACVLHDKCYRHGWKTYGISRTQCDNSFKSRALNECSDSAGDIFFIAATFGAWLAACKSAAFVYYRGVQNFGESSFHRQNGTCCEYRGTPATGPACIPNVVAPEPPLDDTGVILLLSGGVL